MRAGASYIAAAHSLNHRRLLYHFDELVTRFYIDVHIACLRLIFVFVFVVIVVFVRNVVRVVGRVGDVFYNNNRCRRGCWGYLRSWGGRWRRRDMRRWRW